MLLLAKPALEDGVVVEALGLFMLEVLLGLLEFAGELLEVSEELYEPDAAPAAEPLIEPLMLFDVLFCVL